MKLLDNRNPRRNHPRLEDVEIGAVVSFLSGDYEEQIAIVGEEEVIVFGSLNTRAISRYDYDNEFVDIITNATLTLA